MKYKITKTSKRASRRSTTKQKATKQGTEAQSTMGHIEKETLLVGGAVDEDWQSTLGGHQCNGVVGNSKLGRALVGVTEADVDATQILLPWVQDLQVVILL